MAIGLAIGLPIAATSTSEEAYGHTGLIVAGAAIAAEVVGDYLIQTPAKSSEPVGLYDALMSNCEALLEQAESDDNAVNQLFPIDFADPQWEATNAYSPNPDEDDRALAEFLNDLGNVRSWAFPYEPTIS